MMSDDELDAIVAKLASAFPAPVSDEMDEKRLADHVLNGRETLKVDLKWQFDVHTPAQKLDFAKDMAALATTKSPSEGRRGYLILGCQDASMRIEGTKASAVSRFQPRDDDALVRALSQTLQQIVEDRCDPPPTVMYSERMAGGEIYGLITVVPPDSFAVWVNVGVMATPKKEIWLRRAGTNPYKSKATDAEIKQLYLHHLQQMRMPLLDILRKVRSDQFVNGMPQFITLCLADERPDTRMAAAQALREIGPVPEAHREVLCELLIGLLTDRYEGVIAEALRSLVHLGDERVIPAVRLYCEAWHEDILLEAARALGAVGGATAIPVLAWIQSLCPESSEVSEAAENARQQIETRIATQQPSEWQLRTPLS